MSNLHFIRLFRDFQITQMLPHSPTLNLQYTFAVVFNNETDSAGAPACECLRG
jgi:hypothetical protein